MLKVKEWNASLINNSWILLFSSDLFSSFAFHFFFHCIFYNLSVNTHEWVSLFNNVFLISSNIYFTSLPVCLYPINVKTAEPIWPRFCLNHTDPKAALWKIKISKISLHQNITFIKFRKFTNFLYKFFIVFQCLQRERLTTSIEDGRDAP